MEAVYQLEEVLRGASPAEVLHLLQESASQHQHTLGTGREAIARRGLLWMITWQKLVFDRLPFCGEKVTVKTWLSEARHGMYLRHYEVLDASGAVICRAVAEWTLVDAEKRTLVQLSLPVPLTRQEGQLPRFHLLRSVEPGWQFSFSVPQAYLDENGHMNNARYFDAVAPILPKEGILRTAQVDYHLEALAGETLAVGYTAQGKNLLIQAQGDRGLCFRMKLEYE